MRADGTSVAPHDRGAVRALAVVVGGMVGTAARLGIDGILLRADLAAGTLVANVLGAFLLGLLLARQPRDEARWLVLGPGFLGALTTFSALQLEAVRLVGEGRGGIAAGYLVASVLLGLVAAAVGRRLGQRETA